MKLDPHALIEEIVAVVGKREAIRLLVKEGVSSHTAPKIVGGRYPSEIGILLGAAIQRVALSLKREVS